jgi:preprotein translocase subunit SecA
MMEALREGISLRGYGQKDPKQEYKKEGFEIFGEMITTIGRNVCEKLFHMQVRREEQARPAAAAGGGGGGGAAPVPQMRARAPRRTVESGGGAAQAASSGDGNGSAGGQSGNGEARPVRRNEPKVGRNDPCPCGSGKKYKKCHGAQVTT